MSDLLDKLRGVVASTNSAKNDLEEAEAAVRGIDFSFRKAREGMDELGEQLDKAIANEAAAEKAEVLEDLVDDLVAALEASHNQVVLLFCEEFAKTLTADRCDSVKRTLEISRDALAKAKEARP